MMHPLRHPEDFYPTPPAATRALLSVEAFSGPVWEPACGDGAIAKVLIAAGHSVVSTDLVDRGWGTGGVNFLAETTTRARHIVTNPPYGRGLADAFVRHALKLIAPTDGSVAMLLALDSLAHPRRTPWLVTNPPSVVYILDELACPPPGRERFIAPDLRFCWCVWKPHHTGRPSLWWLCTRNFRRKEDAR